jgi:hypothetical protein
MNIKEFFQKVTILGTIHTVEPNILLGIDKDGVHYLTAMYVVTDDISDIEKDINLDDIDNFMNDMDNTQTEEVVDFNDNFGLNNISYDYDDNDILYKEEVTSSSEVLENNMDKFEALEFLGEEIIDDEDFTNLDDLDLENNFDFLSKEFDEPKQEIKKEEEINQVDKSFQGDNMDEFFELDSISENEKSRQSSGGHGGLVKYTTRRTPPRAAPGWPRWPAHG